MNRTKTNHTIVPASRALGARRGVTILLALVAVLSFSCRRPSPAAPPAPAPPPPAPTAPAPPAPTITLSAAPATVNAGQSTTLRWESRNANSVVIEPGIGMVAATGMQSVSPSASVTYTATATGPGGTATNSVRVTVNAAPAPAPAPSPAPTVSITELFNQGVGPVYFDYDQFEIRSDQVARLRANADFLRQNGGVRFTVGGHADERGTQEYNIGLADRRASAVRSFLLNEGIAADRMDTVSYGEERPVCQQQNEACWGRNRRAEFAIRQ